MKRLLIPALLVPAAILFAMIVAHDPQKPNWEIFPDMARSAAFRSQSPNPYFANGLTEQSSVPGTIALDSVPFHYTASVSDFVRAGDELHSPFTEANPPDLPRGKKVYETYCEVCHGLGAQGDGPVVKRGFPAPPSLLFGKALNMKDGHLFYIVSLGFRKMPAYAPQVSPADRWQVIAYVRKLQNYHGP